MHDFDIEGIDKAKLLSGLANEEFSDFEDCLQMECAKSYGAEYIVTRNSNAIVCQRLRMIYIQQYSKKTCKRYQKNTGY